MSEFQFSEEFHQVDFINQANKLRDDSQYLNNQPNITDRSKSVSDFLNAKIGLKEMKIRSPDKFIWGHVNINLIRNKLDSLVYVLDKNLDIFLISETKLHDSFPSTQFKIEWRTFHHVYCNVNLNVRYKIFPLRSRPEKGSGFQIVGTIPI